MIPITIKNRPFASEYITGLMLPDGIFEASLGRQQLNAYFTNTGVASQSGLNIYVESASHPAILISPTTHYVSTLSGGASTLQSWEVNISNVPPGKYYFSFIAESAAGRTRIIKRIFVTKVTFNDADKSFTAEAPEGKITVSINELWTSKDNSDNCECKKGRKVLVHPDSKDPVNDAIRALKNLDIHDFKDCPPQTFLVKNVSIGIEYTPPFSGQYGDLPYQDPWWKTLFSIIVFLCVIALLVMLIGGGSIGAGPAGGVAITTTAACCSTEFFILAGIVATGVTSAILSSASDARDPFRRGQDNTLPGAGELTTAETLEFEIDYIEPLELGKPYAIGTKWKYGRITKDASAIEHSYYYSVEEVNNNVHTLSHYEVDAPDVVKVYEQKKKPFIVKAKFYNDGEQLYRGHQLFVKCFLQRKSDNKIITFMLEDNGQFPDSTANEGVYTGTYYFNHADDGFWKMLVVAQDINHADESMTPDEAAQIIGGQVLTNQLTITYSGGTCPLVPDGELHVMG